jgi:hypothetical protein
MNRAEMTNRDMKNRKDSDPAPAASANITPSKQMIFITLGILVPILLLFVALFSGTIQP